jgi:DNA-binding YbaB/EbfC family protein
MSKRRTGGMPGGMGGFGGGNQAGMMRQLQKMREQMEQDMAAAREALEQEVYEISKAGIVTVKINGHQRIQSVTIHTDKIDTTDAEWGTDLSDLVTLAVNEAIEESQRRAAERMEAITGNMGGLGDIPGLGGLFG